MAFLWEFLDPPELQIIPEDHRRHLRYANQPPPNTMILAGTLLPGMKWGHGASHMTFGIGHESVARAKIARRSPEPVLRPENAYISGLGFKRLFFIVYGTLDDRVPPPFDISEFAAQGMFARIWPDPKISLWPRRPAVDDEIVSRFALDEKSARILFKPPAANLPSFTEFEKLLEPNRKGRRAKKSPD